MTAPSDPHVRFQNVALEHAELLARRSMNWAETTNRTTMFMTVVGAGVIGLALIAQTSTTPDNLALLALLIFSIVLLIGLTTLLRIVQLDQDDMRLIQGLNRLRHVRLQMDPGLAPYLVTSPHDDFDSVLQAYGPADASWLSGFSTLAVLVLIVNCALVGVVVGVLAVNVGADAVISVVAAVVAAVGFAIAMAFWFFRAITSAIAKFEPVIPARKPSEERPQP